MYIFLSAYIVDIAYGIHQMIAMQPQVSCLSISLICKWG